MRRPPARTRVHRVEDDVSPLVDELDLRKDRSGVAKHREANLDPDGQSYVDRRGHLVALQHTNRPKTHDVVSRSFVELGPLPSCTGTSEARLQVAGDNL